MIVKQAITQSELFSLMQIRCKVFMHEQNVDPLLEIDDFDKTALHYILINNNEIIGTCRVICSNDYWHLGRIAILKEYRHLHYGSHLLHEVELIAKEKNIHRLELGAQLQALPFYIKLGYQPYGDIFLDANIEHRMVEKLL